MDDHRPQNFFSAAFGGTIFLMLAFTSCLPTKPPLEPSPTSFSALTQEIAKFRGLEIRRELALTRFAASVSEISSYGPFQLQSVDRVYRSLGLLPNNVELGLALVKFDKLRQLALYDALQGTVAIAPITAKLDISRASDDSVDRREAWLDFAIVTALQEQNFQWRQNLDLVFLEDRRLAFRALAVGDALLIITARAHHNSQRKLTAADLAPNQRFVQQLDRSAAGLPEFLRQKLTFPYREGSQFAFWAFDAKGWPGVSALYADPPVSTAQILHPEKYFIRRESVQHFFPAALLGSMRNDTAVEQSLGEQLVRTLLATAHGEKIAGETAAPWRGDQLFSFQDGENLMTAWYSSWASTGEAARFQRAYRAVLEERQRVRFDAARGNPDRQDGQTRDGRAVTLQVKGPVVLFLTGVPSNQLNEFADRAWQDLEIDSDSTAAGFDLAKRRTH